MKTFLKARWKNIVMVNYEVDPEKLLPFLPAGLELDFHEGKTFVSLVGFRFLKSRIFGIPIPFFGSFDEVNLRFYVKRTVGEEIKRGVVFISEIVPNRIVSLLANLLYKEHYSYAKMWNTFMETSESKSLGYFWKKKVSKGSIEAVFELNQAPMISGGLEEFIYEHYYGFTKVNESETWEYKVNHPKWDSNKVISYAVSCDFGQVYGKEFSFLTHQKPFSVYNAIGSEVTIDWKINKIKNAS